MSGRPSLSFKNGVLTNFGGLDFGSVNFLKTRLFRNYAQSVSVTARMESARRPRSKRIAVQSQAIPSNHGVHALWLEKYDTSENLDPKTASQNASELSFSVRPSPWPLVYAPPAYCIAASCPSKRKELVI
jgi:hypothetical protein